MKITGTNFEVIRTRTNEWFSNLWNSASDKKPVQEFDPEKINLLERLYRIGWKFSLKEDQKKFLFQKILRDEKILPQEINQGVVSEKVVESSVEEKPQVDVDAIKATLTVLTNFFTEFEFEPNFRFVNTLFRMTSKSTSAGKAYIVNYFKLIDSPDVLSIKEKIKSAEFDKILESVKSIGTSKQINSRFKLYYGSQGTGKTTQAMKESEGRCMVCHSAMLPSDLMEDFKFEDGKATFIPSALQNAMVNGKVITLDEINLLPFESLRFLQSILDGKASFEYKGKTINIKEGFKIIGTMNLQVNGSIYSLPEPLVDRAEELREYKLTADNLVGAVI